ncbi:MAG TPA: PQQ-binding-like beta-propeller repeat protein [Pyrinomonadaceae bacterium]|nr:PQQ-binding-like beta-propeller repeat protein [Pyrinomonadaceae bacterium]
MSNHPARPSSGSHVKLAARPARRLRQSTPTLFFALVFASLFAPFVVATVRAQAMLWTHKPAQEIKWYRVAEAGTLLVGTPASLYMLNPESGETLWRRDDLKGVAEYQTQEIAGTPLLLVSQNSGRVQGNTKLSALDALTGQTIWETEKLKGATVQVSPVYDRDMVLLLTTRNASASKDKPDIIALKLSSGETIWESEFTSNVDLYGMERGSRYFPKFDLSGAQPPVFDGDSVYFTYAGLHRYNLSDGKLVWKVDYDVTEGKIKQGNAQAVIDGDTVYTSAKGQVRAIDKNTGAVKWASKDFGGAVAEMHLRAGVLYGRLGGTFYDFGKREYVVKKPLGVVALDPRAGTANWFYDKADDSITNLAFLPDQNQILIADSKNLIALDTAATGKAKEAYKVKLEFKFNLGAAATVAKVAKFGFGGLSALGSKGGDTTDEPVSISRRENGTVVVRGKQHLLAFDPRTKQIAWSTKYAAPGVPGWQKIAMTAITIASAAMSNSAEAAYASQGNWRSAGDSNRNFINAMSSYEQFMSKRYTATKGGGLYVYVLTDVKQEKEKGAGVVGVNMETGQGDRQIMFKDKEPDYEVDEASGRVFNLKNSKELNAYIVK